jgi:hypothetical protein
VTVTLKASSPCLCGYLIPLVMIATVRVNRRSMRSTGPMIGAFIYTRCPECGTPVQRGGGAPRTPYVLVPDSAREVAEYRRRKWGDDAAKGAARETVA